jgi:hypothetical protein
MSGPTVTSRVRLLVFAALLVGLVTGCPKKPTMTMRHAEVTGMQLGFPPQVGVLMTVVVDVYNPNGYDVAIRAMRGTVVFMERYTLPIDFRPGGEGVWLGADQTTAVRVPVNVPVDLAMTLVREAYTSPTVPFRMYGRADVTGTRTFKIESDDYSVDERGVLSRQQIEASIPATFFRSGR